MNARAGAVLVALLVCGCGRADAVAAPVDPCGDRCAHESEWFAGCMMACRQNEPRPWLTVDPSIRDAGTD